ncbi:uncharacterized protein LOC115215061 [Argonauta hians]
MAATLFVIKLPKQNVQSLNADQSSTPGPEIASEIIPSIRVLSDVNEISSDFSPTGSGESYITGKSSNDNIISSNSNSASVNSGGCTRSISSSSKINDNSNSNTITSTTSSGNTNNSNEKFIPQDRQESIANIDDVMQTKLEGSDIKGQPNTLGLTVSTVSDNLNETTIQSEDDPQSGMTKTRCRFQVTPVVEPEHEMQEFIPRLTPEMMLKNILDEYHVKNDIWTDSDTCKLITFIDCGKPARIEDILKKLMSVGIGQKLKESSISVFPASMHVETFDEKSSQEKKESLNKENESKFRKSVKSRLVVEQVVESVRTNAVFTFDYCMLIILASMISVLGLVENSSVVLVASMLISPLMGPILAGTFGIVIQNYSLRNLGLRSESIGLAMCIVSGFFFGLIIGTINLQGVSGYIEEWPTMEMKSRGMSRSLWIGILIALPSGAGVSLSVLGGNSGPLVGVAISASLLPPAVNAGMLWSFSLLSYISPPTTIQRLNDTIVSLKDNPQDCLPFQDNGYVPMYSCNMAIEMGIMGTISLLLTLINIICIFLVGVIMLKVKEVVPLASSEETSEFWECDIRVARDSYKTMKGPDSQITKKLLETEKNRKNLRLLKHLARNFDDDPYRDLVPTPKSATGNFDHSSKMYKTLPSNHSFSEQGTLDSSHTIHSSTTHERYSECLNFEKFVASPGVRIARPFSFVSIDPEQYFPCKIQRSQSANEKHKHKPRKFWSRKPKAHVVVGKEKKFSVTSVPESTHSSHREERFHMIDEEV